MSIDLKYHYLETAYPDMLGGIGMLIQKAKISKRFKDVVLDNSDLSKLENAKNLCELSIVEIWNDQNSAPFKALCSIYFDIASQLDIDINDDFSVFEYIKIIAFGYLGEGWHLVKQYLKTQEQKIDSLPQTEKWNSRLLNNSFKALVGLIRKKEYRVRESLNA